MKPFHPENRSIRPFLLLFIFRSLIFPDAYFLSAVFDQIARGIVEEI
jgi:hypothetical protein